MKYILNLFLTRHDANDAYKDACKTTHQIERVNNFTKEIILTTGVVLMFKTFESKFDKERLQGVTYEGVYIHDKEISYEEVKRQLSVKIISYV